MNRPFAYTSFYYDQPPQDGRALDFWLPPISNIKPLTLCFVHGGGWRQGRRDQMHEIMMPFFRQGYACVSLDYRLKKVDPAVQVSDLREGMALVNDLLRERGFAQPLVLFGSSAGGHLALLAGLAAPGACGDDFTGVMPEVAGIVASCAPITLEPWDEIFPGSWDSICDFVGAPYDQEPERYRRFSPLTYGSPEAPPLFFLLADSEHMFPNAKTIEWARELRAAGVQAEHRVYPNAEHGFFYALTRQSQQMALADLLGFLQSLEPAAVEMNSYGKQ
ncbi:MAG TPA: alpha/beta hydrolase [Chthoniobacteraceae bacterium]|nr:alpha/beta hydrolase [Chthoniobacteraceae bacterium]